MKKLIILILIVLSILTFVKFSVFADPSDIGGPQLKSQSTPIEIVVK